MRRTLTLGLTVAVGGILMCASSFGLFGIPAAHAQQGTADTPIISPPPAGDRLQTDGGIVRVLAGQAQTNGALNVFESVQRPGSWAALHTHGFAESFYVVEGTLTVQIDQDKREITAGSYVFIPAGILHAQGNQSTAPVKTVLTTQPAQLETRFRQQNEEFRKEAEEREAKEKQGNRK